MDPVTVGAVGVGGFAAWKWLRGKFGSPLPVATPGCSNAEQAALAQQTAAGAVGGAASGAPAGPVSAGAGAGLGALSGLMGLASGPCGKKIVDNAGRVAKEIGATACAKADKIYKAVTAKGGSIPGYNHMTCDEKLAAATAAASPLGITVIGGVIVGGAAVGAGARLNDWVGDRTGVHTSVSTNGASIGNDSNGASVSTHGASASVGGQKVSVKF